MPKPKMFSAGRMAQRARPEAEGATEPEDEDEFEEEYE
jgi:hypothetical protein